jgi:DNA-directed RNA polymerase omega subunit
MLSTSKKRPEPEQDSPATAQTRASAAGEEQWPGIDSSYRLIVVAALRSKQLLRGSTPRIEADPRKRKNTSIALEEVKQGLVAFTITSKDQASNGDGASEAV